VALKQCFEHTGNQKADTLELSERQGVVSFFKVLKLQVAELCWSSFLATCALSAAIEAAFQLRRLKSWFRSRLIDFFEMQ
jgi:hypothetical protein